MNPVSVTQLNRFVKGLLTKTSELQNVSVKGELSNFLKHHTSGHMYFTLKDEGAAVKCVIFAASAKKIKFQPENGMSVVVKGSVSLYERDGSYQFYGTDMEPEGLGALYLAFNQTKEKLQKAGLLEEQKKRPIPAYPRTIGIVTSKGAAALQDMLNILSRRYPLAQVLLYPAQVQGEGAAQTIAEGIRALNAQGQSDVIIIGRGGGSMEDLWAFNDEALAYTIAESNIPVVSGVGHETDFTIADFVADKRAPTPSAAAELVTPNLPDVMQYMDGLVLRSQSLVMRRIQSAETKAAQLKSRLISPEGLLERQHQRLLRLSVQLKHEMERQLERKEQRLCTGMSLLEAKSPLGLLRAGYSITAKDGKPIRSVQGVSNWEMIETRLSDGVIYSQVTDVAKKEEPDGGKSNHRRKK